MTPTDGDEPDSGASPNGAAVAITSPQRAPGPTRAIRRAGSTRTEAIGAVLTRIPPSQAVCVPCPVAWTANGTPWARAVSSAARTSAAPYASATSAGWESTAGLSERRASS